MTLTPENMRTDPSGNRFDLGAVMEDVYRMDYGQLEKYVIGAFTSEHDREFLPAPFWDYYFAAHNYQEGMGDGRSAPSPGSWFAQQYIHTPHYVSNGLMASDGATYFVDFEYRSRFERVLTGILTTCLRVEGDPSEKELLLAAFSVQAVEDIEFQDGANSTYRQFADQLEVGKTYTMDEWKEIQSKVVPAKRTGELFELARRVKEDKRYFTDSKPKLL